MDDGAKPHRSPIQTESLPKDEYLEQALEDAARMIHYASDGKISDPNELKYIQKLVKITELIKKDLDSNTINGVDLAEFYSSLAIMSHLLFPVTMESLRKRERMTESLKNEAGGYLSGSVQKKIWKRLCEEKGLLIFMVTVMLFALVITPLMASYSLTGSDIVTRLDKNIKDLIELKKDSTQPSKPPASSENEKSDSKKNILDVKRILINDLYEQLNRWNNTSLGCWVFINIIKEKESDQNKGSNSSESKNNNQKPKTNQSEGVQIIKTTGKDEGENKEIIPEDDDLKRMKDRLPIKSKGLTILQTVNQVILPLLFGFCGTAVFLTRRIIQSIQSHTYTGVTTITFMRIILGSFCGFFLGYLGSTNELVNLLTFDVSPNAGKPDLSLVSPLTLAFVGGYSVDILVTILNRFIYAVTNDDKYLPTSEMINKKVDTDKLLPKG